MACLLQSELLRIKAMENWKSFLKFLTFQREVYTRVNSHFLPLNLTPPPISCLLFFLLSLLTHSLFSSPLQLGMHNIDLIFYLECSYFNMLIFFYFGSLAMTGEKDSYLSLKVNHVSVSRSPIV